MSAFIVYKAVLINITAGIIQQQKRHWFLFYSVIICIIKLCSK